MEDLDDRWILEDLLETRLRHFVPQKERVYDVVFVYGGDLK